MFLSITTTHQPATDLGFLLFKNPARVHEKNLKFGHAHLFFPEATETRCTAALVLDIDPVSLVRGQASSRGGGLFDQYVTDRVYAASSLLSLAISRVLGTAMSGRSRNRQELADTPIPLEAVVSPLPCRGGSEILERLFVPLGYAVEVEEHPLDPNTPDWGMSQYVTAKLTNIVKLSELLTHLFVLIPVLDNQKHYWVGSDEVEKLLVKGDGWLETHPEKEMIALRYLKRIRGLQRAALEALAERVTPVEEDVIEAQNEVEEVLEKPIRLNDARMETVTKMLVDSGAKSVIDLGCGEGKLLRNLLKEKQFTQVLGADVSTTALTRAAQNLKIDRLTPRQASRIDLIQGTLTYHDDRLKGYDAVAVVEVIEHLELDRIPAFERAVFASANPPLVVVSTPNREYNATFENLEPTKLRHPDHRFEWTRIEFETWAKRTADTYGYSVEFFGIGAVHETFGAPTQMGVFRR